MNSNDLFWCALTVYHEARGESIRGQSAVVKVILNRADKKNKSVRDIVLAPYQFSCFNKGLLDPCVHIKDVRTFGDVMVVCSMAMEEWQSGSRLEGADHYFALRGMPDGKPPTWAKAMTFITEIGGHKFYRE